MNVSIWGGRVETHIWYEHWHQRRKTLKSPFTWSFKGNTDIHFLFHLGRFICNKKKEKEGG